MADRTTQRPYVADIIDIGTAAKLIRAKVFTDGQRCGTTEDGHPVWSKFGTVVVDMRPDKRFT